MAGGQGSACQINCGQNDGNVCNGQNDCNNCIDQNGCKDSQNCIARHCPAKRPKNAEINANMYSYSYVDPNYICLGIFSYTIIFKFACTFIFSCVSIVLNVSLSIVPILISLIILVSLILAICTLYFFVHKGRLSKRDVLLDDNHQILAEQGN